MSVEVYTPFQRCMQTVLDTALHVTVSQSGHERTVIKRFVDHDPAGYQRFVESIHQFNPFPNPHPAMQIEICSLFGAGELGRKAAQETVIKVIAVSTGFPWGVVNLMISYCDFDAVQKDFNYGVELVKQGFPKGKLFEVKRAMLLFNLKNPHKLPNEGTVYSPFQLKLLQVAQHADERYAACSQLQNWTGFKNGVVARNWMEGYERRYEVFAKRSTIIDDAIKDYINRLLQFIPYPCPPSVEMEAEILYRLRAELMAQKEFRSLDNPRSKEDVDAREAMMRECFTVYPIDDLCQKQLLTLLAAADCDNRKAS